MAVIIMVCFCFPVDLLKEIDDMAEKYTGIVRDLSPVEKTEKLKKMEESFAKAKELSDDKVQLAMQTYEMVSKIQCNFCINNSTGPKFSIRYLPVSTV
jgi:hypothetical protein